MTMLKNSTQYSAFLDDSLMDKGLIVTGLPGSGKSRVISALQNDQLHNDLLSTFKISPPPCQEDCQVWCVIDVRTSFQFPQDDWLENQLKSLVNQADGIVFSFLEGASLETQMWWSAWVKEQASGVPIVRWFNQSFPTEWTGFSKEGGRKFCFAELSTLQTFHFEVDRLVLEHLLFGLDSSRQNLGMKILRVKGMINTTEYANLVAIEGSALRWDMFAAEQNAMAGTLTIQGVGLEQVWLDELVNASLL